IPSKLLFELLGGWPRIVFQEMFNCHDESRRTETALNSTSIEKRLLNIANAAFARPAQALNGLNGAPLCLTRLHKTRTHKFAIKEHGTRSALSLLARVL